MADKEYMGFVWDENKAAINKRLHGISFETATRVFNDPCLLLKYDEENSSIDEDRFNCIGLCNGLFVVFVSTTERDGRTRIISARKAVNEEVKDYENNAKKLRVY